MKKLLVSTSVWLCLCASTRAADFAIRDGDTVVFLGDSITAARTYGKIIENYTLLRYPQRRVRFINAGWGGDTAAGGLARLDRDVFSRGATLLTVAYGINDIGWGTKADDEHRWKYLDSIRGIVEACKRRGVRVYICSAAITAGDRGDDDYLQKMCDEGMTLSRSLGEGSIDVMRTMRPIQNRVRQWTADHNDSKETLHAADGVHLNDLGHLAMAFAILKGLGAPAEVSSVTLSAGDPKLLNAQGCRVTDLAGSPDRLAFTRFDDGLPLNHDLFWQLNFRFIPIPEELNRYMLTVKDLPPGRYEVRAAGRLIGAFDAKQLSEGVNLASTTPDAWQPGGPWDAQAHLLRRLTDARHEVLVNAMFAPEFLAASPNARTIQTDLEELDASIQKAQRDVARPVPCQWTIEPRRPTSKPS
jgi:lysophospholipase L1-like esterase